MKRRSEILHCAEQLLRDPSFGYSRRSDGQLLPWADAALGRVIALLQGLLPEQPESFAKGLTAAQQLADFGFEKGLQEQLNDIARQLLATEGNPPRLKRPELQEITTIAELVQLLSYLKRLWVARRANVQAPAAEKAKRSGPTPLPKPMPHPTKVEIDERWAELLKWQRS